MLWRISIWQACRWSSGGRAPKRGVPQSTDFGTLSPLQQGCNAVQAGGVNPFDYRVNVLARVQDHPANAIDELLPVAWAASD